LGRGLGWGTHRGPCQLLPFCDSVILLLPARFSWLLGLFVFSWLPGRVFAFALFGFSIFNQILAVSLPRPPAPRIVSPTGATPRRDASRHAPRHATPTHAARRRCPRTPLGGCARRGTPASPAPLPPGRDAPPR